MKTRRNAEKSTAGKIWNLIENKLEKLKFEKIGSFALRKITSLSSTNKISSEDFESIGANIHSESKLKSFHEKLLKYNSIKKFEKSFYNFRKIPLDNQKKLNKDFKLILNKLSK